MRKAINYIYILILSITIFVSQSLKANSENNKALYQLVERIGGKGSSQNFMFKVDNSFSEDGKDVFILSRHKDKILIKANTLLSASTGLNWYLNHYLHINLSWNNSVKTDLNKIKLVLPQKEEKHICKAEYRYYFNYCTFSYSCAFWNWERWQQEIDWMALHGVNMPLMLVGMDVVWRNILVKLNYSSEEISQFIAGPAFQAWWLMNNLEGWGGPNPEWWYKHQEDLSKKILKEMRAWGMKIVLPGYSGMVPSNIGDKMSWKTANTGMWCGFKRPSFLNSDDENFGFMAELYYKELEKIMGKSEFYSMDPFHEGGNTNGVNLFSAYKAIENEMLKANPKAIWLMQSWNENPRKEALMSISKDKLLILDLFSEVVDKWREGYMGHNFIFCMLHNFGGRIGLHGRLDKIIKDYYQAQRLHNSKLKGVGVTAEGIETNPILYDLIFELAWQDNIDSKKWVESYVNARYNKTNQSALQAWTILLNTVYNCPTGQQGTSEPIICARPNMQINSVSTWSTSKIYYDKKEVIKAAKLLLDAGNELSGNNYNYDLTDICRQVLSDIAEDILVNIKLSYEKGDTERLYSEEKKFLELILDIDRLLATNKNFRLAKWIEGCNKICNEAGNISDKDRKWLEWNARTLITVWGNRQASNQGGLHDYSYREWAGLLKDFHYKRWKLYFDSINQGILAIDWYTFENAWTEDFSLIYENKDKESTYLVAKELVNKYFK